MRVNKRSKTDADAQSLLLSKVLKSPIVKSTSPTRWSRQLNQFRNENSLLKKSLKKRKPVWLSKVMIIYHKIKKLLRVLWENKKSLKRVRKANLQYSLNSVLPQTAWTASNSRRLKWKLTLQDEETDHPVNLLTFTLANLETINPAFLTILTSRLKGKKVLQ